MSRPIWDKKGAEVDERIMAFTAGEDVVLDRQLFRYDIRASKAHVVGLASIEVLSDEEARRLVETLDELDTEFVAREFVLDDRFEDMHSAIEAYLIEKLGDLGRKVHTGRSRNDQVLVAIRLYLRDTLAQIDEICRKVAQTCLERAAADDLPMPGYTHLQRAVPSSTSMWFAAFAETFIDNAQLAQMSARFVDANPLGTAAGYGVNLPLDRDLVDAELGFGRQQVNPIYAQNSRGKFELQALMALAQPLLDVRRLAWDLSLFTTAEFDFVSLPDRFTTGSSIMPNKCNPDVVELLRGTYAVVQGAMAELQVLLALPSGYQRDLQGSKPPLLRAMNRGLDALHITAELVAELSFNAAPMAAAIDGPMHATDRAVELTVQGVPFRKAYRQVAQELDGLGHRTPEQSLQARTSPGAAADLRLQMLRERLEKIS